MLTSRKLRGLVALCSCVCAASVASQDSRGTPPQRFLAGNCPDYVLIDLHGSGAGAYTNSPPGLKLKAALQRLWPSKQGKFETVPFKAAGGLYALTGAGLNQNRAYRKSLLHMESWLRETLRTPEAGCADTPVILSGYSQGAQAVADVYQEKQWAQVVGVVLFGDPSYNHKDTSDHFGLNVAPKLRNTNSLDGALAAPSPRKAFNDSRVWSYCHQEDPVCQAPLSNNELVLYRMGQHNNYDRFQEPERAAKYFVKLTDSGKKSQSPINSGNKWPTTRNNGPHGFFAWLGANFIIPDWSSCDANYCIIGSGNLVLVFTLKPEYGQIGTVPANSANPRDALLHLGVPALDIRLLLA